MQKEPRGKPRVAGKSIFHPVRDIRKKRQPLSHSYALIDTTETYKVASISKMIA
jgi:hypothetical protein